MLNVVGRHIEIVNATAQLLFLCKVSHMNDSEDSIKGILMLDARVLFVHKSPQWRPLLEILKITTC